MTPAKDQTGAQPPIKSGRKKIRRLTKLRSKPRLVHNSDWKQCDPANLASPALYINRELSWLEFNQRVLDQAFEDRWPLLERIKFLAITASNLDEFFMIRVATILKKIRADLEDVTPDGLSTYEQLTLIRERSHKMMVDQIRCWSQTLRPLLAKDGIHFIEPHEYSQGLQDYLKTYFKKEIFPVLTPLAFDPGHPFPYMSNLSMNFAVVVRHGREVKLARVKIPSMLPRFIPVPAQLVSVLGESFVFLEDVIRANMPMLFPGAEVREIYLFRLIRDTDIVIQEDEADDLLESVDKSLKQIRYGALSHLLVESRMPRRILDILTENFEVEEDIITTTDDRMGLVDWMSLLKLHRPQLKDPAFSPGVTFDVDDEDHVFDRIKTRDYLVCHPYESFTSVETFLEAAIRDPMVIAIKMTLYRVGPNSPIIDQLIQAVEAGKQVAVLVELKARFDEKNNIVWARRLEEVGVHVVYGLLSLKTHCKLCLVVRKEAEGIRRYVHVGTGNYNRVTSKIYTDLGFFTADDNLADDVTEIFNYLTGYSNKKNFNHLLVAPLNLRSGLEKLIEREIKHAQTGLKAHIIFKVNAVVDPAMIRLLYKASQAGVQIDLIVRGVCALRPKIPGISDRIRVISIVGRFLEHARIFYFFNDGHEQIFIGSADLMSRNLDRRVETVCPIENSSLKDQIKTDFLDIPLKDNQLAYELNPDGSYHKLKPAGDESLIHSQNLLLDRYSLK